MTKTFIEFAEEKLKRPLTIQEKAFIQYIDENPNTHLKFPGEMKRLEGIIRAYNYLKKG